MKTYVLSLMAANQVGIIAAVTDAIRSVEGNVVELSQTVMRGFFTIILAVDVPDDVEPTRIVDEVHRRGELFDLEVNLRDAGPAAPPSSVVGEGERYVLTVKGQDRPGVIYEVARRLSERGIDITDLYAVARDGGFLMVLEVVLPNDVDAPALRRELQEVSESVGLTARFQHENIFRATNSPQPVEIGDGRRRGHVSNG